MRPRYQPHEALVPGSGLHDPSEAASPASALYVGLAPGTRPLRVALVAPAHAPAWMSTMLELAGGSGHIQVGIVPITSGSHDEMQAAYVAPGAALALDVRAFLALERWLLRTFLRLAGRDDASPLVHVELGASDGGGASLASAPHALDEVGRRVRALEPDLVLLHGPGQWAATLAACARHGCWLLDASLVQPVEAGAALLGPILSGEAATPFTLQLQREGVAPVTLAESWGATRALSVSQQRDNAFRKLPAMLLRGLRELVDGNRRPARSGVARLALAPVESGSSASSGLRALAIMLRLLLDWRRRRKRARRPWYVLLREQADPIDPASPMLGPHRSLLAPGADYWADPFPFSHEGRQWLFVEEYVAAERIGVIRCLELLPDGTAARHGIVLAEPHHLSFPQVWRRDEYWYMTVESADGGKVCLYRSREPFGGWSCVADLIQGRTCVDPTLYEHEGAWYLFANVAESGGNPSDELFLFTADAMEGPYRPHPANPIVSDVRRARMAGRVFIDEQGRLIRPAQCCAPIYGTAVVFNQIIELGADAYAERALSRLDACWAPGLDGCHTYYRDGRLEVLDAHGEPPPADQRVRLVAPGIANAH